MKNLEKSRSKFLDDLIKEETDYYQVLLHRA